MLKKLKPFFVVGASVLVVAWLAAAAFYANRRVNVVGQRTKRVAAGLRTLKAQQASFRCASVNGQPLLSSACAGKVPRTRLSLVGSVVMPVSDDLRAALGELDAKRVTTEAVYLLSSAGAMQMLPVTVDRVGSFTEVLVSQYLTNLPWDWVRDPVVDDPLVDLRIVALHHILSMSMPQLIDQKSVQRGRARTLVRVVDLKSNRVLCEGIADITSPNVVYVRGRGVDRPAAERDAESRAAGVVLYSLYNAVPYAGMSALCSALGDEACTATAKFRAADVDPSAKLPNALWWKEAREERRAGSCGRFRARVVMHERDCTQSCEGNVCKDERCGPWRAAGSRCE